MSKDKIAMGVILKLVEENHNSDLECFDYKNNKMTIKEAMDRVHNMCFEYIILKSKIRRFILNEYK